MNSFPMNTEVKKISGFLYVNCKESALLTFANRHAARCLADQS